MLLNQSFTQLVSNDLTCTLYREEPMARHNVSEARKMLSTLLDDAEEGKKVLIERGGRRFELRALPPVKAPWFPSRRKITDPILASGQWTWAWDEGGVTLKDLSGAKPKRKRKK